MEIAILVVMLVGFSVLGLKLGTIIDLLEPEFIENVLDVPKSDEPISPELIVKDCTRDKPHDGPCNGFLTSECVVKPMEPSQTIPHSHFDPANESKDYMLAFHKQNGNFIGVRALGHSDTNDYEMRWPNGDVCHT